MSIRQAALVLLVAVLVTGVAMWKRREQRALYRLLKRQAEETGGRVKAGTLLYYPKLTFAHEGVEFTASALLGGSSVDRRSATTYVSFPIAVPPSNTFRIRKKTKSIQAAVDRRLGIAGPVVRTGDHAFDDDFLVRGENGGAAKAFLTDEIRARLLAFDGTVDVKLEDDLFIVTVDEIVRSASTLGRMLDLAVLAHRVLRPLAGETGSEVQPPEAPGGGDG